jgi:hypothetical protein
MFKLRFLYVFPPRLMVMQKHQKHKDAIEPYIEKLVLKCLDRYGNILFPYVLAENDM